MTQPGTVDACRHCGGRIVLVNWALGPRWTHQHSSAAFQDGIHEYCYLTVAEPVAALDGPTHKEQP